MNKRTRILVIAVAAFIICALGLIIYISHGPTEPVYKGRPLIDWIDKGYITRSRAMSDIRIEVWPEEAAANEAVRSFGTNAVPFLLKLLEVKEDSALTVKIRSWLQNYPIRKYILGRSPATSCECGSVGLSILGPDAKPAIPACIRLLETGNWDQQLSAGMVLYNIGSNGIAPLARVLANRNAKGRSWAANFLREYAEPQIPLSDNKIKSQREIAKDGEVIVPILENYIRDTNEEVRTWAICGLGAFGQKSDAIVPILIGLVEKTNSPDRLYAIQALGMFGTNARPAIPALEKALKNGDTNIQNGATWALNSIRGKPPIRAGIK